MIELRVNKIQLNDIRNKLRTIAVKAGRKTVRNIARNAMAPVRDQVKRNAPYDPTPDGRHIRSNVSMRTSWRGSTLRVRIGIRGGAKANHDSPWYFRLQEFGSKHQQARPFMRPALEDNAQKILDAVAADLTKALFS